MTTPQLTYKEAHFNAPLDTGTFLAAGWYLTTAEAAAELDIDYRSVWKAITLGHITARRVGRRHLIPAAEVVRYRDRRAAAVPARPPRRKQGHRGGSGVQSYPKGAPGAPSMVVYHHIDGSTHYVTRHRALALAALNSYNGITPEGDLVNRLFVRELDGLSRARIIHHLDALHG
ncbi:hypothetical protein LCGC14_1956050, partial [marine sediment metagenome]